MVKLFISGFPLDSSELELVQLVGPYATVNTIKIVRDKITKKCKGYAFIEVTTEEEAKRAIEMLDGAAMRDRELTVNIVEEKPPAVSKPPASTGYLQRKKRPRRNI